MSQVNKSHLLKVGESKVGKSSSKGISASIFVQEEKQKVLVKGRDSREKREKEEKREEACFYCLTNKSGETMKNATEMTHL